MSDDSRTCEALERRLLLHSSAVINDKQLLIRGDFHVANTITVGMRPDIKTVVVIINHGAQLNFDSKDFDNVKIVGGPFSDTLVDDQSLRIFPISTTFVGGAGNDTLTGGDGNDLISGDSGNDFITTGAGDDQVLCGSGDDTVSCGTGTKTVFGDDGNDTIYGGRGANVLFGGNGNDKIVAFSSHTELFGNAGNDTLIGMGFDSLWGGGGVDVLTGGSFRTSSEINRISKLMSELRDATPN